MPKYQMKRKYAEWMEDAFTVTVPNGVTEDELRENFDALYEAAFQARDDGEPAVTEIETATDQAPVVVEYLWQDENRSGVESLDDELEVEWQSDELPVIVPKEVSKTYMVAIVVTAPTEADLPTGQDLLSGIQDGLPEPWFEAEDGDDFYIERMVSNTAWPDMLEAERKPSE